MAKARQELQKFEKQAGDTREVTRALFDQLAVPLTTAGIVAVFGSFVKSSFEAAAALETLQHRAQAVYGKDFPAVAKAAEDMGARLGRSGSDVLGFMTDFTTTLGNLKLPTKDIEDMSSKLAQLTIDFGSYFGVADQAAFDMIQGGILGMGRAIKRYNIDVSDAALQDYAARKQIQGKVADMSDQEKQFLRTNMIIEQMHKYQGDAAGSANTLANRAKNLSANYKDVQEQVGGFLGEGLPEFLFLASKGMKDLGAVTNSAAGFFKGLAMEAASAMGPIRTLLNLTGTAKSAATTITREGLSINLDKVNADNLPALMGEINKRKAAAEDAQKKADETLRKEYGQLPGGGGSGGADKAAAKLKEVQKAMTELGNTYADKRRTMQTDIKDLAQTHKDKMDAIGDQTDGVVKQIRSLGEQYSKTVREIQRAQKDLDTSRRDLTDSGQDELAKQFNKIKALKDKFDEANAQNGALSADQIANVIQNRRDKDNTLSYADNRAFNLTSGQADQVNAALELQREEQALKDYIDTKLDVSERLKQDLQVGTKNFVDVMRQIRDASPDLKAGSARVNGSDFQRFQADQGKKGTKLDDQQTELNARSAEEKKKSQEQLDDLQKQLGKLTDKKKLEEEAYTVQRQQLTLTQTAMAGFEADYTLRMKNISKVTLDEVAAMKTALESLKNVLSSTEANGTAQTNIDSGIYGRQQGRLQNTPGSYLNTPITVTINTVNVNSGQDAATVGQQIARQIQLQLQGSSPAP